MAYSNSPDPITDEIRTWLRRRALQGQPNELCGFILDNGSIIEIPNSSHNPTSEFRMSARHLSERIGDINSIIAIWHTHPKGSPHPSKTDIDFFSDIGPDYANRRWRYLIATSIDVFEYDPESFAPKQDSFWAEFVK